MMLHNRCSAIAREAPWRCGWSRFALVCAFAVGLWPEAGAAATAIYHLGNLPGGNGAVALAINDSGVVGGAGWPASGQYAAILFDVLTGGTNTNLNPSGGWSTVRGISNSGQIVGFEGQNQMNPGRALLFDPSGSGNHTDLGTDKRAYAINENNRVVGGSGNGQASSAWLWDLSVGVTPLLLGQGEAAAISDNGLIVGSSYPVMGQGRRATRFDPTGNGNNVDLGKLFVVDDRSVANAVNDSGQIVGHSGGPSQGFTATLFDFSGSGNNVALGAVGNSFARDINNLGHVVGEENGRATLFDITGAGNNVDLNTLIDPSSGWVLWNATRINDLGWIIGSGNRGAFLLAPDDAFPDYVPPPPDRIVPEPNSFILALLLLTCATIAIDDVRRGWRS